MSWKSRSTIAIASAVVLTGGAVAAVASTMPAAGDSPSNDVAEVSSLPSDGESAQAAELKRSVDDLLGQVDGLEGAVAAGSAVTVPTVTAVPVPTTTAVVAGTSGSTGSDDDSDDAYDDSDDDSDDAYDDSDDAYDDSDDSADDTDDDSDDESHDVGDDD